MNSISMYVIMHKDVKIPKKNGYKSLLVGGAVGNSANSVDYRDDNGDNISEKNKSYCELTGMYWIWKNDNESEIIGINHYRRFFTDNYFSMSSDKCLSVKKIENIMKEHDVIVSRAAIFGRAIKDVLTEAPSVKDMNAVKNAIDALYPGYSSDFQSFMNGNKYYPYNMLIMKKKDYNAYCEWLFNVLDKVEEDYGNPYTDTYRSRLFGFLSERLLYVWVNHNYEHKKIKQLKVLFTEENIFRSNYHIISNFIRDKKFLLHNSKR